MARLQVGHLPNPIFEPHRIGGQPSPRWGQAAGTTATRDRLGSVARLLRIRSCLTLTARPGGSSTGRRHLCQHCGEARIAYCVQTWLPIHLINRFHLTNRFYLSPAASSLLSAAGHGHGPPADGRVVERSKFKNMASGARHGPRSGFTLVFESGGSSFTNSAGTGNQGTKTQSALSRWCFPLSRRLLWRSPRTSRSDAALTAPM
jgi:hypothetical protein